MVSVAQYGIVLEMIEQAAAAGGKAPGNRMIAVALGVTSVGTASDVVTAMERLGLIKVELYNRSDRVIEICSTGARTAMPRLRTRRVRMTAKPEHVARSVAERKRRHSAQQAPLPSGQPAIRKRRAPANALPPTTLGITPGFTGSPARKCRWLEGEPSELNWCDAPTKPGSSYCPAHHARCYTAPADYQRGEFIVAGRRRRRKRKSA